MIDWFDLVAGLIGTIDQSPPTNLLLPPTSLATINQSLCLFDLISELDGLLQSIDPYHRSIATIPYHLSITAIDRLLPSVDHHHLPIAIIKQSIAVLFWSNWLIATIDWSVCMIIFNFLISTLHWSQPFDLQNWSTQTSQSSATIDQFWN